MASNKQEEDISLEKLPFKFNTIFGNQEYCEFKINKNVLHLYFFFIYKVISCVSSRLQQQTVDLLTHKVGNFGWLPFVWALWGSKENFSVLYTEQQ